MHFDKVNGLLIVICHLKDIEVSSLSNIYQVKSYTDLLSTMLLHSIVGGSLNQNVQNLAAGKSVSISGVKL